MEAHSVYSFVSGLFHSTLHLWNSPVLLLIIVMHLLSLMCNSSTPIELYENALCLCCAV